MNAYKRRGLTWSDVLDHCTWGNGRKQLGIHGRLAGNQFYLKHAAALRREHISNAAKPRTILFELDRPIDVAVRYVIKAREWRLELQGAL
jgi:hypothetical protein